MCEIVHEATAAESGGKFTELGWRAFCTVCRTWWLGALDDQELTKKAAYVHTTTGEWP